MAPKQMIRACTLNTNHVLEKKSTNIEKVLCLSKENKYYCLRQEDENGGGDAALDFQGRLKL